MSKSKLYPKDPRYPHSMAFHVGPHIYHALMSERRLFDRDGNELEGCAIEGRRLIVVSRVVSPQRRDELVHHELVHAWAFHVPKPRDEEERCQLHAFITRQYQNDLDAQGGIEALERLQTGYAPHIGVPRPEIIDRVRRLVVRQRSVRPWFRVATR